MKVAQVERCCIYQRAIAFFGGDFKSPQDGFCERIFYRASFISTFAFGAEAFVRSNQQNAGASTLESHDVMLSELTSIQTEVIPAASYPTMVALSASTTSTSSTILSSVNSPTTQFSVDA